VGSLPKNGNNVAYTSGHKTLKPALNSRIKWILLPYGALFHTQLAVYKVDIVRNKKFRMLHFQNSSVDS
jgi:hypothetical protein